MAETTGINSIEEFEIGPIRLPSEAGSRSLLLRFSRNCSWNRCTFCYVLLWSSLGFDHALNPCMRSGFGYIPLFDQRYEGYKMPDEKERLLAIIGKGLATDESEFAADATLTKRAWATIKNWFRTEINLFIVYPRSQFSTYFKALSDSCEAVSRF